MEREIIKKYIKGDLTIIWKPKACIHDGTCVKSLPEVYDPKAKPWIKPENASIDALKKQIDNCPSGALSYSMTNQENEEEKKKEETKILVKPNGPLLVYGTELVIDYNGEEIRKERVASFCRCGSSKNLPFCDGQHKAIGFKG